MEPHLTELRLDSLQNQMKWLVHENQILQQRVTLLEKSSQRVSLPGFQTVAAPVTFGTPSISTPRFGSPGPGYWFDSASVGSITGLIPVSFDTGSPGASSSVTPPQ